MHELNPWDVTVLLPCLKLAITLNHILDPFREFRLLRGLRFPSFLFSLLCHREGRCRSITYRFGDMLIPSRSRTIPMLRHPSVHPCGVALLRSATKS